MGTLLKSDTSITNSLATRLVQAGDGVGQLPDVTTALNTDVPVQANCNKCYETAKSDSTKFMGILMRDASRLVQLGIGFQAIDESIGNR